MSYFKIAHRGASAYFPENTMLAFRKGIEMGANALELDVFCCKSGEAVVIHDETLTRTTNGRGLVAEHTLAELKRFDAGQGEAVPTLKEVLAEFAEAITVFIEIKETAAVGPVVVLIQKFAAIGIPYASMPVIGFDESWLLEARTRDARIVAGSTPDDRRSIPADYCATAKQKGMWSVNPSIDQLNENFMREARGHGLKVITWTVNSHREIEKARALGVDGIISDYPDRL
jgi:glycerophosphoryl diester phosphodiesterase